MLTNFFLVHSCVSLPSDWILLSFVFPFTSTFQDIVREKSWSMPSELNISFHLSCLSSRLCGVSHAVSSGVYHAYHPILTRIAETLSAEVSVIGLDGCKSKLSPQRYGKATAGKSYICS